MTTSVERLAKVAFEVGCPQRQIEHFLSVGYVPQPKQLQFHAAARMCDLPGGPDQIGFGGARGPGKSHAVFAQLALDDCRRFPAVKALYLRKVGKQAREQFDDLRRSVLHSTPHEYNRQAGIISLWNDSRIIIGHFNNEKDVDNYLGMEYDVIAIEEATTLSATKYKTLRDSNRSSKPGVRPRIYATTNPGGIGHAWFRQKFVEPWRSGPEAETANYSRFIPATVTDNLFIDDGYRRKLEENTGWRLRAYRYGDWDIAAGQFFTTFRYDLHVREPFPIPLDWTVWAALDYGFTHPTAVYLLAMDADGVIYGVDEHVASKWLPNAHAVAIREMLHRNNVEIARLRTFVAGSDVFANKGDSHGRTIADQYAAEGIRLSMANNDRINGAAELLKLLGDQEAGRPSRLQIFDRCRRLIETMPILEHDPHRPEDVLKTDVDEDGNGGDDSYDAFRYGVMAAPGRGTTYSYKYGG